MSDTNGASGSASDDDLMALRTGRSLRAQLLAAAPPHLCSDDDDTDDEERGNLVASDESRFAEESPSWRALLSPSVQIPRISVKASALSLMSTMVGGGALSIPFAVQEAGLITATVFLIALAFISEYSLELLLECGRHCQKREASYGDIAEESFGCFGRYLSSVLTFSMTFLAVVAYLILLGNMGSQMLSWIFSKPLLSVVFTTPKYIISLVAVAIYPIACVKQLSALRFTSLISLCSVMSLAVCMCGRYYFQSADSSTRDPIVYGRIVDMRIFLSISVMSVSYVCHFNVLPAHFSLKRPTRARATRLIRLSIFAATTVYLMIGISGYLTFSGHVEEIILDNYKQGDMLINVGRVGMSLTLLCGIPLIILPTRALIEELFFKNKPFSPWRSSIETAVIITFAALVASNTPSIVYVWSFVGSTASSLAMLILPPACLLRLQYKRRLEKYQHRCAVRNKLTNTSSVKLIAATRQSLKAILLIMAGTVLGVLCTLDAVLNVLHGSPGS